MNAFKNRIISLDMPVSLSADECSNVKIFYDKYTNIKCEDYDGEFTVGFNADMYISPSPGWFFSCRDVRYDV